MYGPTGIAAPPSARPSGSAARLASGSTRPVTRKRPSLRPSSVSNSIRAGPSIAQSLSLAVCTASAASSLPSASS